jgi:hypothetical protein
MELYEKGDVKVLFKEGNLVLVADTAALHSENTLKIDYLFDKIKKAIPGTVDDAVLELISGALKAL